MEKTKKLFIVSVILLIFLMLTGMTRPLTQAEELAEQLKNKTMEILQLRQTVSELRLQIVDYQTQLKNDRIALEPARFASEKGNNTSLWLRNPDHLKNVWKWTQQYQYLLTPEARATAKDFNIEFAIFCWFFSESGYDPNIITFNYQEYNKEYYLKKNGGIVKKSERSRKIWYEDLIYLSTDWYMAQINDVCWNNCYNKLPEHLKKKKKSDPEVAVAMYILWIDSRVEMQWSWCYLSADSWTLMWRLNHING